MDAGEPGEGYGPSLNVSPVQGPESAPTMDVRSNSSLLMLSLPGVQRYISESRTTADLVSASTQVAELARIAAAHLAADGADVVFPADAQTLLLDSTAGEDYGALPNRIVALVPTGEGRSKAEAAAEAVRSQWRLWVGEVFPTAAPDTPGFPDPQWVLVPPMPGGYAEQFSAAQRALAARRRVRSFRPVLEAGQNLCSLSVRWPAVQAPINATRTQGGHRDGLPQRSRSLLVPMSMARS